MIGAPRSPETVGGRQIERVEDHRNAIHHGHVDHLTASASRSLHQRRRHAHREHQSTTGEVAHEVDGHRGWLTLVADGVQRSRQRDVVDVVTGRLGEWSVLSPTGHAREQQSFVTGQQNVRPDAQTFADPGTEWIDQHVGSLHQFHERRAIGIGLQIEGDASFAPHEWIGGRSFVVDARGDFGTIDRDHVSAEIGEDHRAVRAGSLTHQLDHSHAGERTLAGGHEVASSTATCLAQR